jgi:transcription antitermination factor NusG
VRDTEERKFKNMKNKTQITEAQLLCNQEVKINRGQFAGKTALVRKVMADGRSLEVEVAHTSGKIAFIDVTFVSEIQERTEYAKGESNLGPVANSVVQGGV